MPDMWKGRASNKHIEEYIPTTTTPNTAMKYTAARTKFIFTQEMQPCPACGSYHLGYSTPIQMKEPITADDSAKQILGKWARAVKDGHTMLEGPVRIVCRDCHHKGPAMDCTGRTSEEVGRDKAVADEVKRLWNSQPTGSGVGAKLLEGQARQNTLTDEHQT